MTNYRQTMADTLEYMYMMREYKLMERELTDDEKKRREEIAQDMDDADFKERYGDRWKEVKMAVATKQAKEEEFDLDEATKWKMGDGRPRGGSHIENVRFWDLSKDELQYIMKDAGEAMKANPTGRKSISGPGNYADQVNDAQTVLVWRKKNGIKEDVDFDEARQLKNPKKEVLVVKSGKVIVINKKDAKEYLNKGWDLAEEVDLDEWTVSDVEIAMKKKYGKIDKEAIEKLKKVQHRGNVDRNDLVKVGHGKLHVEEVELDEDNMDLMRKAAKGAAQTLKMKDGKLTMDSFTASGIMQVYDGVNPKNKVAMEKMINTGLKGQIAKLQALAMKASKGGRREEIEVDESAGSDAMKAIRKDKDLGKRGDIEDDDSASDDDIKGASKNIIMQMRKVQSLRGKFAVEFEDNKKIKIPEKIAIAVQEKYNSFKKPRDKIKFAEKVAKSYKSMLSALKENTIIDRIGKKIQERKVILEASNRWELGGKKFSLVNDKGTYILVTQGTGEEKKLKAKTPQDATQELVKKGYRES